MSNLEKIWSLRSGGKRSQLQQQQHWRTSSCNSPRVLFTQRMEKRKKYTVANWNILSRSWKNLRLPHWSSTISNTHSKDYDFSSRRLWSWTMTTSKRGVAARFVCSLPIPSQGESGSIYSATLVTQPRRCGLTSRGALKTTSRPTRVFTAKGKKNRLLYII